MGLTLLLYSPSTENLGHLGHWDTERREGAWRPDVLHDDPRVSAGLPTSTGRLAGQRDRKRLEKIYGSGAGVRVGGGTPRTRPPSSSQPGLRCYGTDPVFERPHALITGSHTTSCDPAAWQGASRRVNYRCFCDSLDQGRKVPVNWRDPTRRKWQVTETSMNLMPSSLP